MRKILLCVLILISQKTFSQKYLLIDRQLIWQSYLSDTITKKIAVGYFPIYRSELDSLLNKIEPLWNIEKYAKARQFLDENEYSTGHIRFKISIGEGAYGAKYNVLLISQIDNDKLTLSLCDVNHDASSNRHDMQNFIKQLRKSKEALSKNKIKEMKL